VIAQVPEVVIVQPVAVSGAGTVTATLVTLAEDVLQVAQLIAPALVIAIGDVPVRPALPTAEIGIALAATAREGVVVEFVTVGTNQEGQEPEGAAKLVTLPVPPLIVLQPNPVPVVHVRALEAPEQPGSASPDGVVAVRAPRTVLAVCVARLALGSWPVTAVARGRPVAFVRTNAEGVPSAGVTSVGEVASTALPVPVHVSATICPLPLVPVTQAEAGMTAPLIWVALTMPVKAEVGIDAAGKV
jgi:hypothetical protein